MTIAFEIAFENKIKDFTIKPTGDTAQYYRKKFNAKASYPSGSDLVMTVHLKTVRTILPHIRVIEKEGTAVLFKVKGQPDRTPSPTD